MRFNALNQIRNCFKKYLFGIIWSICCTFRVFKSLIVVFLVKNKCFKNAVWLFVYYFKLYQTLEEKLFLWSRNFKEMIKVLKNKAAQGILNSRHCPLPWMAWYVIPLPVLCACFFAFSEPMQFPWHESLLQPPTYYQCGGGKRDNQWLLKESLDYVHVHSELLLSFAWCSSGAD